MYVCNIDDDFHSVVNLMVSLNTLEIIHSSMLGCRRCGAPTTSGYCHICISMREDICKNCGVRIFDGIRTQERFLCRRCKGGEQKWE